jgi:NAD-reducing hydrogenase large subunit
LLSEGPFVGDSAAPLEFSGSSGVAVVDSPRGLLLHKLKLSKGSTISSYEIISPLQFNHDMLNDSLSKVALDAVDGLDMDDAVSGRLELIVRSFNPCVSCGTH